MKVVFTSMTGKTKQFVGKLNLPEEDVIQLPKDGSLEMDEPFVLLTYTINFGEVPKEVQRFLANGDNRKYLRGVASSGNPVWGDSYGRAAKIISSQYQVPNMLIFTQAGYDSDVEAWLEEYNKIKQSEGVLV